MRATWYARNQNNKWWCRHLDTVAAAAATVTAKTKDTETYTDKDTDTLCHNEAAAWAALGKSFQAEQLFDALNIAQYASNCGPGTCPWLASGTDERRTPAARRPLPARVTGGCPLGPRSRLNEFALGYSCARPLGTIGRETLTASDLLDLSCRCRWVRTTRAYWARVERWHS